MNKEGLQIYDRLLELPLFQGMNHPDLASVIGHTRFGFLKLPSQKIVVKENDLCLELIFLVSGIVNVTTTSDDYGYTITEELKAPTILQPEHIFGLTQRFTKTFTTINPCSFITLDREETKKLSDKYDIFRINLLNIISTQSQKLQRNLLRKYPASLEERIVNWIRFRCLTPVGHKNIKIKMTQLAKEINDSRLDVSRALNRLETQGWLTLSRGHIDIPSIESAFDL